MFNISAHEDTIQAVIAELLEHQERTGNEAGVLLGPDGERVADTKGDFEHIEWKPGLLMQAKGGIIIHNHPNHTSLSDVDLMTAGNFGLSIMAVNEDGSRFWATPEGFEVEEWMDLGPDVGVLVRQPMAQVKFEEVSNVHAKPIANVRGNAAIERGLPKEEAETAVSHEFVWQMARAMEKVTPYRLNYQWKLGSHARASIIDWNRVMEDTHVPLVSLPVVKVGG